tara:strand:+ start:60 stop:353 length:294 start_codon:yes stop_codon:yes gene_type:complete
MKELIGKWKVRMVAYRIEADTTESDIQRVKAMQNFMMLRDCINEVEGELKDMSEIGVVSTSAQISDFEMWLNKKENKAYCSLPAMYVLDKYKIFNSL